MFQCYSGLSVSSSINTKAVIIIAVIILVSLLFFFNCLLGNSSRVINCNNCCGVV